MCVYLCNELRIFNKCSPKQLYKLNIFIKTIVFFFVFVFLDLVLQFHEIVPDMDDEFVFGEKQSIRESARSLKKYGSTCCNHNVRSNEALIRHDIERTDTLQGIALKYGCTVSQSFNSHL